MGPAVSSSSCTSRSMVIHLLSLKSTRRGALLQAAAGLWAEKRSPLEEMAADGVSTPRGVRRSCPVGVPLTGGSRVVGRWRTEHGQLGAEAVFWVAASLGELAQHVDAGVAGDVLGRPYLTVLVGHARQVLERKHAPAGEGSARGGGENIEVVWGRTRVEVSKAKFASACCVRQKVRRGVGW